MRSSTWFPEPGIESGAPLEALWRWMLGAGEHVVLGIVLGWMVARAFRALNLRWTWAPIGVVLSLSLAKPGGSTTWMLGIAGFIAARSARRQEPEHRMRCGDIEAGRRRHGLARFALRAIRAALRRWRLASRRWFLENELLVGYDEDRRPLHVPLVGHAGGAHTLVVGAAGSGKTVTQTWIAVRAIEAGLPAIVIDAKDDPDLAEGVKAAALNAGKRFYEWSPEGPSVYNPYDLGSDSEIADKALAGEHFTEPHYQRQAQRFLAWEVRMLRSAGMEISLPTLAVHLDPDRLESVLRSMPEADAARGYKYLDSLSARQRSDLSGVRDRLAILAESDVGRWLDPRTPSAGGFGLLESLRGGAVVLFRLRSDSRPLLMQMLGGAIVLDLLSATSVLQRARVPSIAVIDEFAALAAPHVGGLFGRARGAGLSLVLSTQEVSDLHLPGRQNLLRQVAGNLTTTISHRQVNPESAEWVSELAGMRQAWQETFASDGRHTFRSLRQRRLLPEQVTSLRPGEAAVIVHDGPSRSVRIGRMLSIAKAR